jgi:hypothetical protein
VEIPAVLKAVFIKNKKEGGDTSSTLFLFGNGSVVN